MSEAAALTEALAPWVGDQFGRDASIAGLTLLAGGASQQSWRLDITTPTGPLALVMRRDMGGRMFAAALGRADEFAVIERAYKADVPVPRPYAYPPDVQGKAAFVMACLEGETLGRRIVREERLAQARAALPAQMDRALAAIHSIPVKEAAFLPGPDAGEGAAAYGLRVLAQELATVSEPSDTGTRA